MNVKYRGVKNEKALQINVYNKAKSWSAYLSIYYYIAKIYR